MNMSKLAVTRHQVHRYGSGYLAGATTHLCDGELEPVNNIDPGTGFRPCHRITNRFPLRLDQPWHHQTRVSPLDVDLELDLRVKRIKHGTGHRGKDIPHCCPRLGLLTVENFRQGSAL